MPPPKSNKTLTAAQKETAQAVDRRGGRVPAALVVHRARRGPALPAVKNEAWVRNPIDRFVLAKLEADGLTPGPRGRPPDAGPPAQPRPDRPAARPDGRRGVRRRHVARRLREVRRSAAGLARTGASIAAGTGSTPPATPTPTASTSTTTARSGPTATGSSTPSTSNMPFDQFTVEQLAGDLLPNAHARPADRLRLQPLQHHDQRGRGDRRGVPGPLHPRPDRDRLAGLAGADGRLRRLPRPQVRPAHPEASSTRWRRSSTTRRRGRWTATSRTRRPIVFVPRPEDRAAWDALSKDVADVEARLEARKQAARADFDKWLAAAKADDVASKVPTDGLVCTPR